MYVMQAVRQGGQLLCEVNAVFGNVFLPNADPLLMRVEEEWGAVTRCARVLVALDLT